MRKKKNQKITLNEDILIQVEEEIKGEEEDDVEMKDHEDIIILNAIPVENLDISVEHVLVVIQINFILIEENTI